MSLVFLENYWTCLKSFFLFAVWIPASHIRSWNRKSQLENWTCRNNRSRRSGEPNWCGWKKADIVAQRLFDLMTWPHQRWMALDYDQSNNFFFSFNGGHYYLKSLFFTVLMKQYKSLILPKKFFHLFWLILTKLIKIWWKSREKLFGKNFVIWIFSLNSKKQGLYLHQYYTKI